MANFLSRVLALLPCVSEDTTVRRAISRLIVTVALGLLVVPLAANAQQPGKANRIGVLATTYWPPFDSFREGLRAPDYVEGYNMTLEYR